MDFENISDQSGTSGYSTPTTSDRSSPLDEPAAASCATEDNRPDEEYICHECSEVNWDSLPSFAENMEPDDMIIGSKTLHVFKANYEQLATSSCKICLILSVVMPQSLRKIHCFLQARQLSQFRGFALPHLRKTRDRITALQFDTTDKVGWWDACDSRCLVARRRDGNDFSSRAIPTAIDYDRLKNLVRSCEEAHNCAFGSRCPVSGLKVIEVTSRTIIEASVDCRYVALSYVWGKETAVSQTLDLQHPPQLIEDAISVTIVMGYEYLWIDRYVSLHVTTNTMSRCKSDIRDSASHRPIIKRGIT